MISLVVAMVHTIESWVVASLLLCYSHGILGGCQVAASYSN